MKKLVMLFMTVAMIFASLGLTAFAEGEEAKDPVAGLDIPYGVYEPETTQLFDSGRVKIMCEKVHVTNTYTAEIYFTSKNYTKLVMDNVEYESYVSDNKSIFTIPITPGKQLSFVATTVSSMSGGEPTPKDIPYTTAAIELNKTNPKPASLGTLTDGYYTTTVNSAKETYGYVTDGEGNITQLGFNYPKANYDFPVTVKVEGGKIADVAYTNNVLDLVANTSSDINYLMWAMDGHNVTDASYNYLAAAGKNYEKYHVMPKKNGVGLKNQIVEKEGINGVDTVTAATITSRAIIDSVDKSIIKAERGEKDDPAPELPTPDTSEDIIPEDGTYIALGKVDCIGASVDNDVAPTILYVTGGEITADIALEQNPTSYPHIFAGTEAEALTAGETEWLTPSKYDYGYVNSKGVNTPGSVYKNVPIKSLDKKLQFVMFANSSGNWFNRLITIESDDIVKITEETTEEFNNFVSIRNGAYPATTVDAITAAKNALVRALVPYTPSEDDGARDKQNDTTNNVVYTNIGMFRPLDAGTTVTKDGDTVTVKVKLNPLASGNYDRMAIADYPASDANVKLDAVAIEADDIEESEGPNGQTGETTILYSPEFTFQIKASEVGKKIPFVYSQDGKWKTKAYYLIVLTDEEVANRKKAIEDAAKEASETATGAVEAAQAIVKDKSKYDAESYAAFEKALKELNEVLAKEGATATEINAAKEALDAAIAALKKKPAPVVAKKANPMTAKAKAVKIKYAKLKKKTQKVKKAKAFTIKKAQGKVTFKLTKKDKKAKSKIKVSKAGVVTVKKGLKKGKYTIKVKVTAAGTASYKAASKTIKMVIKVTK